jgi:hypothetical protein
MWFWLAASAGDDSTGGGAVSHRMFGGEWRQQFMRNTGSENHVTTS